VMGIAQPVLDGILEVGFPAVMNSAAFQIGNGFSCGTTNSSFLSKSPTAASYF